MLCCNFDALPCIPFWSCLHSPLRVRLSFLPLWHCVISLCMHSGQWSVVSFYLLLFETQSSQRCYMLRQGIQLFCRWLLWKNSICMDHVRVDFGILKYFKKTLIFYLILEWVQSLEAHRVHIWTYKPSLSKVNQSSTFLTDMFLHRHVESCLILSGTMGPSSSVFPDMCLHWLAAALQGFLERGLFQHYLGGIQPGTFRV